jgi:CheY-like chemotaxis protein
MARQPRETFGVREQSILLSLAQTLSSKLQSDFMNAHASAENCPSMMRSSSQEARNTYVHDDAARVFCLPLVCTSSSGQDRDSESISWKNLEQILQSCVSGVRQFFDLNRLLVDTRGITDVKVNEDVLRQCVIALLTITFQHSKAPQTTHNDNKAGASLLARHRGPELYIEVHNPCLELDFIVSAGDICSTHILSNDALLSGAASTSLRHGLAAIEISVKSCGGRCGWRKAETCERGVVFWLALPCSFVDESTPTKESEPEQDTLEVETQQEWRVASVLSGIRVLVLDPSMLHRHQLREELQRRGASVEIVADGSEGLQLIRTQSFDAVALDLVLPTISGIECLQELARDRAVGNRIPVILGMSDAAEGRDIAMAYELGMQSFLCKPVEVDDMCTVLCRYLKTETPEPRKQTPLARISEHKEAHDSSEQPTHEPVANGPSRSRFRRWGQSLRELFEHVPTILCRPTVSQALYPATKRMQGAVSIDELPTPVSASKSRATSYTESLNSTSPRVRRSIANLLAEELEYVLAKPARRADFVRFCVHERSIENVKFLIAVNDARRYLEVRALNSMQRST